MIRINSFTFHDSWICILLPEMYLPLFSSDSHWSCSHRWSHQSLKKLMNWGGCITRQMRRLSANQPHVAKCGESTVIFFISSSACPSCVFEHPYSCRRVRQLADRVAQFRQDMNKYRQRMERERSNQQRLSMLSNRSKVTAFILICHHHSCRVKC